jgi:hypothetical protein
MVVWSGRSSPKFQRYIRIALMMEAARTSETSVHFYQTTRRYNPKDSHLHTRRRENLKSNFRPNLMYITELACFSGCFAGYLNVKTKTTAHWTANYT